MKITRISPISGLINEMEIDVTPEQLETWRRGVVIQDAMPHLTPDEREFILTGITPQEWEAEFGDANAKNK